MGYSGRYHAASLAAVFIALAVGILIGASLGSDVISGAANDLENSLSSDLNDSRAQVKQLQGQLSDERNFERLIYPAIVSGRLQGENVALIGLGDLPDEVRAGVQDGIEPSGAKLSEVAVVREPPDTEGLTSKLPSGRNKHLSRSAALERAGRKAGLLLTGLGQSFDSLREPLLSRFSGSDRSIDSVVVARYQPDGMSARESSDTDALESSLIQSLRSTGLNVVGVELSDDQPSSIGFYSDQGLASVDDLDKLAGKVALVATLGGAEGSFGVKDSADALLPDLIEGGSGANGTGAGAG